MADMYGRIAQITVNRNGNEGSSAQWRMLRDGTGVTVPWYQALVFEGRCFGMHVGTVSTPIAGHAAIDADQPEGAARIADGTAMIPLYVRATMEAAGTTLAQGGMMCAISNIDVAAGTSTAVTPFNLNLATTGISTAATCAQAYTMNGTDPLTAGNYLELARIGNHLDLDAATSGIVFYPLQWSVATVGMAPIIQDVGSLLLYGEAAANTLFGQMQWAEIPETAFQ